MADRYWTVKRLCALMLTFGLVIMLILHPLAVEFAQPKTNLDEQGIVEGVIALVLGAIAIWMKDDS